MEVFVLALSAAFGAAIVYVVLARQSGAALAERQRLEQELRLERERMRDMAAEQARLQERASLAGSLQAECERVRADLQRETEARVAARTELAAREAELAEAHQRRQRLEQQLDLLRTETESTRRAHAEASAHLQHSERARAEMQAFLDSARERLSATFAELAGKAFDERSQRAALQSKTDLETLLKPFAEQLGAFRQRVDVLYGEEARERAALSGAVNELKTLNQEMATQAAALTRALKGSAKVRGDWGELMLESVLRSSGLVEGAHYDRQQTSTDDEGRRLRPDVVVRLPDERRIVIDSKVNLVAWEEAMNAETPEAQQEALRRHAVALRQHVRDLAERNYPQAVGDSALDVTVAFVPIEGALSAALGFDAALQSEAFGKGVVFASPNTLMAVLRVVDRLWTRDKLQKQAVEISRTGGLLLDSVINFMADFAAVGVGLEDAAKAYRTARARLEDSSHAVIPRARRLVALGVKGRKPVPEDLLPDGVEQDTSAGEV